MKNSLLKQAMHLMLMMSFALGYSVANAQTIDLQNLTDPSIQCTGADVNLTWTASGLLNDFTQIDLSTNGGNTWTNKGQVAKAINTFSFTLPNSTLINCLIRVINGVTVDTTGAFAIAEKPGFRTQMNPNYDRCVGGNIAFAPEISPAGTYLYQWYKDGQVSDNNYGKPIRCIRLCGQRSRLIYCCNRCKSHLSMEKEWV